MKYAKDLNAHSMNSQLKYKRHAFTRRFLFDVCSSNLLCKSILFKTQAAVVPSLVNLLSWYIDTSFTLPSDSMMISNSSDNDEEFAEVSGSINLQSATRAHLTIFFFPR